MSIDLYPPKFHEPPIELRHPPEPPPFPINVTHRQRHHEPTPAPQPIQVPSAGASEVAKFFWVFAALASIALGGLAILSMEVMAILLAGFIFCYAMDRCTS